MSRGQALIVDDSATARIMLARLLEKAEFESRSVSSAEDALRELRSGKQPDVIFLDHLLPGMNGFDALREIKRNPDTADATVFMYTSQNAERYLDEAKALGAAGVISKQINRDQLFQCLEGIVSGREAAGEDLQHVVEDINVAYHKGLEKQSVRGLTGRLSTLEIAYEEMSDEVHHLRTELKRQEFERQFFMDQRLRRYRWALGGLFVFVLLTTTVLWVQLGSATDAIQGLRSQMQMMTDIIGHMLDRL